ncbi:SDR family oxidoreductase [Niabella sp. CC-SYL272]|uniref:SDR family NAD(P)-dependent oxidoreductase n=1 Tax=Niabella agricola TaxID=2891571 RepID=UPI001F45BAF4|nr:SDR family NAD(P)-dependent oxidoreductase [Niabella agricola]MCF3108090.1 SDR family oxidoreductase [Niabella agricola]
MKNRFDSQVAVVTGGAEGIGKAIGLRLGKEGCRVILFDLNEQLLCRTVEELQRQGVCVRGYVVDVGEEEPVAKAMEGVWKEFGKLDIMINCAGIVGPTSTSVTDYCTEDFDKVCRVNLRGAFLLTKYAIKLMERNNYGRILLLSSIGGKEGNPGMCGYASSKSAVMGLVKGVGKEFATTGITVNGLAPAVIKTGMNEHTSPEQLSYMTSKIPMKRLGTVEEVAAISAWIVSKESSFNTGFIFDISGGRATF